MEIFHTGRTKLIPPTFLVRYRLKERNKVGLIHTVEHVNTLRWTRFSPLLVWQHIIGNLEIPLQSA